MGTRLRHLAHRDVNELEKMIEALPAEVSIKQIVKADGKWYCFFALSRMAMRDPLSREDTFKTGD